MEEKPVRTLMVLPAPLHKALRALAALQGRSMNDLVVSAVRKYLETDSRELDTFAEGWLQGRKGLGLWEDPTQGQAAVEPPEVRRPRKAAKR